MVSLFPLVRSSQKVPDLPVLIMNWLEEIWNDVWAIAGLNDWRQEQGYNNATTTRALKILQKAVIIAKSKPGVAIPEGFGWASDGRVREWQAGHTRVLWIASADDSVFLYIRDRTNSSYWKFHNHFACASVEDMQRFVDSWETAGAIEVILNKDYHLVRPLPTVTVENPQWRYLDAAE